MTPKKKAQELFDKYYIICQEFTEEIQCSIQAEQCALVAVDQIIDDMHRRYEIVDYRYWQEVKDEIEKI